MHFGAGFETLRWRFWRTWLNAVQVLLHDAKTPLKAESP
jgi:hypothetical protein